MGPALREALAARHESAPPVRQPQGRRLRAAVQAASLRGWCRTGYPARFIAGGPVLSF